MRLPLLATLLVAAAPMVTLHAAPEPALTHLKNGDLWPDDKGEHINAHGGGLLRHDGLWYWYGEHKVAGNAGNVAHVGVSVYTSADLVNWKNAGIALPVSTAKGHDLEKGCIIERPKVIRCAKTGKFVMWFHLELKGKGYAAARVGTAVADSPTGPFTYVKSFRLNAGHWPADLPESLRRPVDDVRQANSPAFALRRDFAGGQMSRDMTLYVDTDGAAYHIGASEDNATLHISRLTDDYLGTTGDYRRVFPGAHNEAPAIFKARGKYWLVSSGCTGWNPNPARLASADAIFGPWTAHGNPCVGPSPEGVAPAKITFGAQSTYATVIPGDKERILVMFDLWRPKNAIDGRYLWLAAEFNPTSGLPEFRWADTWPPAPRRTE